MKTLRSLFPKLLPYLFIPLLATCATLIPFSQLQAPATPGLISSNGSALGVTTVGTGLLLQGGVLSALAPTQPTTPAITVVTVTPTTTNAFPIPVGRTICLVFRNIPQSQGIDYTVTAGSIVFINSPSVGDVVELACW